MSSSLIPAAFESSTMVNLRNPLIIFKIKDNGQEY